MTVNEIMVAHIPAVRHKSKARAIGAMSRLARIRRNHTAMIAAVSAAVTAPAASKKFASPNMDAFAPVSAMRFNRMNVLLGRKKLILNAPSTSPRRIACLVITRTLWQNVRSFCSCFLAWRGGPAGSGSVRRKEMIKEMLFIMRLSGKASDPPNRE